MSEQDAWQNIRTLTAQGQVRFTANELKQKLAEWGLTMNDFMRVLSEQVGLKMVYEGNQDGEHWYIIEPWEPSSKAEAYNREMDERNRISYEHREKSWLPLHDGE